MKTARCIILLVAALWLCSATRGASPEEEGRAAEQAGKFREAVAHYLKAFQAKSWTDSAKLPLETRIIELVRKLDPPPAIPEEAERRMARARAALKAAQSPADLEAAANELLEAMNQSPWWPDISFNLGVVREKQGEFARAVTNYKIYLLAKPDAADARAVKEKIYELEFLTEKAAKQQSEARVLAERQAAAAAAREKQQEQQRMREIENLSGIWGEPGRRHWQVTISNGRIDIRFLRAYSQRLDRWSTDSPCQDCFRGTIASDLRLSLTQYHSGNCIKPLGSVVTATIDPANRIITIKGRSWTDNPRMGADKDGWYIGEYRFEKIE